MHKKISVTPTVRQLWLDSDITYAQVPGWLGNATRDLKLSVMRPVVNPADPNATYPALVFFTGGGWMDTDHNIYLPNLVDYARAGYVVVGVEYRDSNKVTFPGQLADGKAAIRYLRAHAAHFGIDASKIAVMGESAGGHLASMLAVTNGIAKFDQGQYLDYSSEVQAAIPLYGVVDPLSAKQNSATNDFDFVYRNLLGQEPEAAPDLDAQANPLTYIDRKTTAPFLIFHGTDDQVVPVADSQTLYHALQAAGVSADFYEVTGAQHMDTRFYQPEIYRLVLAFLHKVWAK